MPDNDDLDALLETALARAGEPLNVAAARKALPAGKKPTPKEVKARLGQLANAGRIHRWPGKAEKFAAFSLHTFAQEQVLPALSSGPLTEAEINQHVTGSAKDLVKPALVALLDAGRIHPWPGKPKKFAAFSPQTFAREQVLRALSSGPLTEAEINQHVPKALVKPALAALVAERAVRRHPDLGRPKRLQFGLGPPDTAAHLAAEIEVMFKRLVKAGFEESELQAALRRYVSPNRDGGRQAGIDAEEILAAMHRLDSQASRGVLVDIADLRAALAPQFRDKESFDRVVLELATQEKVQLQSHAWPGRLTDADKQKLIPNGRGGWFDAIGLRLE